MSKKNWIGKNFQDWCKADITDERKINYTLKGYWDGEDHEEHFTSDDEMGGLCIHRVVNSNIEKLDLVNNEWFIVLKY